MATKVSFEGTRELRWLEVGSCLVTYMEAEVEFSDRIWNDWMEAMERPSIKSILIGSWGATQPAHQQWRRATRLMREQQLPVAIVSEARHNFALAKAASWLGTNVEAFRWNELGEALSFAAFTEQGKVVGHARVVALRDCFGAVVEDAEFQGHSSANFRSGTRRDLDQPNVFAASSSVVFETNEEVQAKLAAVQARLAARVRL